MAQITTIHGTAINTTAFLARATDLRMTDCGYPAGTEDALTSYETSAAILVAIEAITGASLLDGEDSPAYQLWQDDPDDLVPRYLAAHYTAEDGDTLHWSVGRLVYDAETGTWE